MIVPPGSTAAAASGCPVRILSSSSLSPHSCPVNKRLYPHLINETTEAPRSISFSNVFLAEVVVSPKVPVGRGSENETGALQKSKRRVGRGLHSEGRSPACTEGHLHPGPDGLRAPSRLFSVELFGAHRRAQTRDPSSPAHPQAGLRCSCSG